MRSGSSPPRCCNGSRSRSCCTTRCSTRPDSARLRCCRCILTTFVGRVAEQRRLAELLDAHRIVTIIGPGGAGKTRLAVEVGGSTAVRYPDGVLLADLAKLADGDRLGCHDRGRDGRAQRRRRTGLQPCDRRPPLAPGVAGARQLRTPPRAAAESRRDRCWKASLGSRSWPPVVCRWAARARCASRSTAWRSGRPTRQLAGDAETLFLERSALVAHTGNELGTRLGTVTELCRRLDGMPLALELAAGRTDVLSEREISDLLHQRFAVLVDEGRARDIHRSLGGHDRMELRAARSR